jgi:predicted O-linked N-acetylglucosamine transferase (SPINDLY family)
MTADQLLDLATERHRAGDLTEARRLYQQMLAEVPDHPVALFRISLLELQVGHPEAALALIERAITAAPGEPRYQFGLGQALAALRRWEEAASAYRRFLDADPQSADAHFALGIALQALGDLGGAIGAYEAAVKCQPDFAEAFSNLGNCHQLRGDLRQAETAYRQALAIRPNYADAMSNLGAVLQKMGRIDEAIELLRAAVALHPDVALYAVNLGSMLSRQRKFSQAATLLQHTVERDGKNAEAAYNLGIALQGLGRLREAAEQYSNATTLRPDYADALNNLGIVYKELGEFKLAGAAYEAAIRAQPDSVVARNNFACLLRTLGRLAEAEAILRRSLEINPSHPALYDNLGNVLKDAGEVEEAIDCFRKALALDPNGAATHSNLAYALSFQALEGQTILAECLRWNDRHAAPLRAAIRSHPNDRSPDRRLRVGYVSPDFREHCQALFTIPLLSHHDHAAFEIFCYSSVERPDDCTRRIAGYADVWREVRPLDDAALCDLVRDDRIDILVDLTMHMADGRPLLFARKPAPVQVAWLAYPGTTGISAMDYRFTDLRLDPPGFENHYSERTIRLPDSFWCFDPLTDQPGVNALPALTRGCLTLGCLNNPCKLTGHTLRLWSGVMRALPEARLVLMAPPGPHRQHLLQRLAAHDIAAERVDFVPYRPRAEYLRSYHDIDLGLDTFPYNGHTTSLDSFWMGVPVVTRVGQTCVGRGGLSQLFNLGLLELAAENDEAFISAAVALTNDLPRLATLRQQLRTRLERSPLMDANRFARNLEAAYRRIWTLEERKEA